MADLKWLDGYSGQSTEELIALSNEYRVDSLLVCFDEAIGKKEQRDGSASLSAEERVIQAVEALQNEVTNGGYEQFFVNPSNRFAGIIVESLLRIGCPQTAAITKDAVSALGVQDLDTATIERAIQEDNDGRDRVFVDCDDRFFAYPENLDTHLFSFIRGNAHSITLSP